MWISSRSPTKVTVTTASSTTSMAWCIDTLNTGTGNSFVNTACTLSHGKSYWGTRTWLCRNQWNAEDSSSRTRKQHVGIHKPPQGLKVPFVIYADFESITQRSSRHKEILPSPTQMATSFTSHAVMLIRWSHWREIQLRTCYIETTST